MRFDKFVKKVESYLGVEVQEGYNGKYWFQYEDQVGSFRKEEKWDDPGVYEARSFHIRQENDHTDAQTDYFAGYFPSNGTQLLHACKPPPAKFPIGALVRGKQNKRAIRNGYAGKTGLVMDSDHLKISWLGEEYPPRYNYGYPERDIELVSAAA